MRFFRALMQFFRDFHAIRENLEVQSRDLVTTPKSINAMTKLLEPRILKDFPEFSWREFKPDAEKLIRKELKSKGASEIRFHRTEISDYQKNGSNCLVTLQSSLQYIPCEVEDHKRGKKLWGQPKQVRYNSELLYVQNADAFGSSTATGAICPNCGAPITDLGNKHCAYCGGAVTIINRHVWTLSRIYEL